MVEVIATWANHAGCRLLMLRNGHSLWQSTGDCDVREEPLGNWPKDLSAFNEVARSYWYWRQDG